MSVSKRFDTFLSNIRLTPAQQDAGNNSRESVVKVMNYHYWGTNSGTSNSKYVGSWGKYTRLRPPRDVDVLFELPKSTYDRFEGRSGNKQSQLLQEIKGILSKKFSTTNIKGDGPIVKVPFFLYNVELIPSFKLTDGSYWICRTDGGGRYEESAYDAEADSIKSSNDASSGMTRNLIRMMKRWQAYCSVPIRSFWIELVAVDFLSNWEHKGKSTVYYDWMIRDFLIFLEKKENGYIYAPGTYEMISLGNSWVSKCKTARQRAEKACNNESEYPATAGVEWQKIFGTDIPITP